MQSTRTKTERQGDQPQSRGEVIAVPTRWDAPERIPIMYADMIFVTVRGSQFLVSFGQAHPPYEVSPSAETVERLKREGIGIQPVARLAIPADQIESMVSALSQVHRTWVEQQQSQGKGEKRNAP